MGIWPFDVALTSPHENGAPPLMGRPGRPGESPAGVIVPERYARKGTGEPHEQQTQLLLEGGRQGELDVLLQFLQLESRRVEALRGGEFVPVDGLAMEQRLERTVRVRFLVEATAEHSWPVVVDGGVDLELLRNGAGDTCGRIVRERWALSGTLSVVVQALSHEPELDKITVHLLNRSLVVSDDRQSMLRTAFIGARTLVMASSGAFLSPTNPPAEFADHAARLVNRNTSPLLAGAYPDPGRGAAVISGFLPGFSG